MARKVDVILISTGQPVTNPRLSKEWNCLQNQGYAVVLICTHFYKWADALDETTILKNNSIIYVGGSLSRPNFLYIYTRIRYKLCNWLFKVGIENILVPEKAIYRAFTEAVSFGKKIKPKLIIAHNLGALPVASILAKYHSCFLGYDAEDLNSAQYDSTNDVGYKLNAFIEKKYLHQVDYWTAASPLIGSTYQNLYNLKPFFLIENVVTRSHSKVPKINESGPLRLFWFSQTIGAGRGLELVIEAVATLKNIPITISLLGSISASEKKRFQDYARTVQLPDNCLIFLDPVAPENLCHFANNFDIGLATELSVPLNRDICLTNKLYTYIMSGLAVLASNTQAQLQFMQQNPQIGLVYENGNLQSLAKNIKYFAQNRTALQYAKQQAYDLAMNRLNWEEESTKFIAVIKTYLPR